MSTRFITVHGTGDETADSQDPKWWQEDSDFSRELVRKAGGGKVEPFIWDGKNDELSRREAAENLVWELTDQENAGNDVVLIGHSHGGSVIATALTLAMSTRRQFDNIKSIVTVGTPFIGMKKQRWLWERLNFAGQLGLMYSFFVTFILMLSLATILLFHVYKPADFDEQMTQMQQKSESEEMSYNEWQDMTSMDSARDNVEVAYATVASSLVFIILTIIVVRISQKRIRELHDPAIRDKFENLFSTRWLGLYDKRDEAINGLMRVYDLRLNLLTPDQTKGGLRFLFVSAVAFLLISSVIAEKVADMLDIFETFLPSWQAFDRVAIINSLLDYADYSYPGELHYTLREFCGNLAFLSLVEYNKFVFSFMDMPGLAVPTAADADGKNAFWVSFTTDVIIVALKLVIILAVFPISDLINRFLIGRSITNGLNKTFGEQIRRQAMGNTTKGEDLVGVFKRPMGWKKEAEELPEEPSTALCNYAADHARETLLNVQNVLSDETIHSDHDLVQSLTEQLSWREMIHTAYFRVPESRDYIIKRTLEKTGLA